jgi:3-methyl-2-oxobutanoate hydroxymethyltransferase
LELVYARDRDIELYKMPLRLGEAFFVKGATTVKVTIASLIEMKAAGEKITMLTAYDTPTAKILDAAGVDCILVGDSIGNAVLGYKDTLPVTMEQMLHHTSAVVRGVERAIVLFDMPFMSYQISVEEGIRNAGRAIKETGANMVKLEGGSSSTDVIRAITECGIPVCGHLGLTPQSVNMIGYKVQGKQYQKARQILNDAIALQNAGASMIVLECVPWKLAKLITERLSILTIGIGAGPHCDGQVLVFHDMVAITDHKSPKFVKTFAQAGKLMKRGVKQYVKEVKSSDYPGAEHSFVIEDSIIDKLSGKKGGRKK